MRTASYLKPLLTACTLLLVSLGALSAGQACSLGTGGAFQFEDGPAPQDAALPAKPEMSVELIKRGQGPQQGPGGTESVSTCDGLGWLILSAELDSEHVGLEFELVDGQLPADQFTLSSEPVALDPADEITMVWADGADDEQESFDFTLVVRPVDRWGRRGPASDPLHISHPGSGGAACSVTTNGPGSSHAPPGARGFFVAAGLFVAFGLARRRIHRA